MGFSWRGALWLMTPAEAPSSLAAGAIPGGTCGASKALVVGASAFWLRYSLRSFMLLTFSLSPRFAALIPRCSASFEPPETSLIPSRSTSLTAVLPDQKAVFLPFPFDVSALWAQWCQRVFSFMDYYLQIGNIVKACQ